MDFDQTQAIALSDYDDGADDDVTDGEKKPIAHLKVFCQKGFPETLFPIYEGVNLIGREQGPCQVHIPLKSLSKQHACIEVKGSTHLIYDKESRNKTRKGKMYLTPDVRYSIQHQEDITLADVKCTYLMENVKDAGGEETDPGSESLLVPGPKGDNNHTEIIEQTIRYELDEDLSEKSEMSSDILGPTQAYEPAKPKPSVGEATQLYVEDTDEEGEQDIKDDDNDKKLNEPSATVQETPAPKPRAGVIFGATQYIPDSDNEEDSEELSKKHDDVSDNDHDAEEATMAYDLQAEDNEVDGNAATQACFQTEATLAYELDEEDEEPAKDDDNKPSPVSATEATQAYVMDEEPTQPTENIEKTRCADNDVEATQIQDVEDIDEGLTQTTGDGEEDAGEKDDLGIDDNVPTQTFSGSHIIDLGGSTLICEEISDDDDESLIPQAPVPPPEIKETMAAKEDELAITQTFDSEMPTMPSDLVEEKKSEAREEDVDATQVVDDIEDEAAATQAFEIEEEKTVEEEDEDEPTQAVDSEKTGDQTQVVNEQLEDDQTQVFTGPTMAVEEEDKSSMEVPKPVDDDDNIPTQVLDDLNDAPTQVIPDADATVILDQSPSPKRKKVAFVEPDVIGETQVFTEMAADETMILESPSPKAKDTGQQDEDETECIPETQVLEEEDTPTLIVTSTTDIMPAKNVDLDTTPDDSTLDATHVFGDQECTQTPTLVVASEPSVQTKKYVGRKSLLEKAEAAMDETQIFEEAGDDECDEQDDVPDSKEATDQDKISPATVDSVFSPSMVSTQADEEPVTQAIQSPLLSSDPEEKIDETKTKLDTPVSLSEAQVKDVEASVEVEDTEKAELPLPITSDVSDSVQEVKPLDEGNTGEFTADDLEATQAYTTEDMACTQAYTEETTGADLQVNEIETSENEKKTTEVEVSKEEEITSKEVTEKSESSDELPKEKAPRRGPKGTRGRPARDKPQPKQDKKEEASTAISKPRARRGRPSVAKVEPDEDATQTFEELKEEVTSSTSFQEESDIGHAAQDKVSNEEMNDDIVTQGFEEEEKPEKDLDMGPEASSTPAPKKMGRGHGARNRAAEEEATDNLATQAYDEEEPKEDNEDAEVASPVVQRQTVKGRAARGRVSKEETSDQMATQSFEEEASEEIVPDFVTLPVRKRPARGQAGRGRTAKEETTDDVATQAYEDNEADVQTRPTTKKSSRGRRARDQNTKEEPTDDTETQAYQDDTLESQTEQKLDVPSPAVQKRSSRGRFARGRVAKKTTDDIATQAYQEKGVEESQEKEEASSSQPTQKKKGRGRGARVRAITEEGTDDVATQAYTEEETHEVKKGRYAETKEKSSGKISSAEEIKDAEPVTRRGRPSKAVKESPTEPPRKGRGRSSVQPTSDTKTEKETTPQKSGRSRKSAADVQVVESKAAVIKLEPLEEQEKHLVRKGRGRSSKVMETVEVKEEEESQITSEGSTKPRGRRSTGPKSESKVKTEPEGESSKPTRGRRKMDESEAEILTAALEVTKKPTRGKRKAEAIEEEVESLPSSRQKRGRNAPKADTMDEPDTSSQAVSGRGRGRKKSTIPQPQVEVEKMTTKRGRSASSQVQESQSQQETIKVTRATRGRVSSGQMSVEASQKENTEVDDNDDFEPPAKISKVAAIRGKKTSPVATDYQKSPRGRKRGRASASVNVADDVSEATTKSSRGRRRGVSVDKEEKDEPQLKAGRGGLGKKTADDATLSQDTAIQKRGGRLSQPPATPVRGRKSVLDSPGTPSLRRRTMESKPRVLFTGVVDEKGEKIVKGLGGDLVDSVFDCTHLVTDKVRRTVKFLCVLSRGLPIVTPTWLERCSDAKTFIDASPFIILDRENEKKYKFHLAKSLEKATETSMLENYKIHVTKSVLPPPDQMKEIIECAGAKYLPKMPTSRDANTIVVSCDKDKSACKAAKSAGISVVSTEFILTGVLQQVVNVKKFLLA